MTPQRICFHVLALLTILAPVRNCTPGASAQSMLARTGELPALDRETRSAVVDSVITAIDTLYVIQETADRMVARLRERAAAGAYEEISDPADLAIRLDEDAREVYDDGHFGIRAMHPLDPDAEEQVEDPSETEAYRLRMRAHNYGFSKVEILTGNVGYLKLDRFAPTELAADVAVGAMGFLSNADALIIDLRQNSGGSASMIRLLATYFFDDHQHLISWYERDTEETVQSWTGDYVPGVRRPDIPLFVLTSRRTASAAEEFSFDMQHLERATLVGDTTAGAGHTVASVFAHFDGFRIGMRMPYGRAFDPKTGEGWEGRGVVPHLVVPEEDAPTIAHLAALDSLAHRVELPALREELAWARQDLEARLHPVELPGDKLQEYTGSFGPRRIFTRGDELWYQREGRPEMLLKPMGGDLFRVGDLDYFRLRFERDDSGSIHRLTGIYDDGRRDSNDRDR